MSATKHPDQDPPDNAPTVTKEWQDGHGETETREWSGEREDMLDKYEDLKGTAVAGGNIAQLTYRNTEGRATCMLRLGRQGNQIAGVPSDVSMIEELYAVDVVKDICESPYFSKWADLAKGLPLTNDQVAFARDVAEKRMTTTEIDEYATRMGLAADFVIAEWSIGMKELWHHYTHGVETYYETAFVFRRSQYGVRTSVIEASFDEINKVTADVPTFSTRMETLIDALPEGEWLYRPPQAEHVGGGRWRITQEWQWAVMWSVVYGGTFDGGFVG